MAGTVNRRYRLDEPLARGGMGEVWRAHDLTLHRTVAVKLLPAETTSPADRQRFLREARAAARLSHPHVVAVYDTGEWDGRPYLVMELLQGRTLAEELAERGPLPAQEVRDIGAQIAAALQATHAAGVIHRDIKPSNLIRTPDGVLKVVDFGIAGAMGGAATRLTQTGMLVGTVAYLAPERLQGAEADAGSDLYALGCVLHELLCGRPPFTGDVATMMYAHVHTPPAPPSQTRPGVPPDLDALLLALLAKDPADRPADAAAVREALLGGVTRQLTAQVPLPAGPTAKLVAPAEAVRHSTLFRRLRSGGRPAQVLAAAVLALALLATGLLWYAGRDTTSLAERPQDTSDQGTTAPARPDDTPTADDTPSGKTEPEETGGRDPVMGSRAWLRLLDRRLDRLDPGSEIDAEVYEELRESVDEALESYAEGKGDKVRDRLEELSKEMEKAQEDGRVVPPDLLGDLDRLGDLAEEWKGKGWKAEDWVDRYVKEGGWQDQPWEGEE